MMSCNVCVRGHFGSRVISCSTVRGVFFRSRALLVSLVLMARASDGTDVPVSLLPASSSKIGSPNGSLPDLEGTGYRVSTMVEKNQRNVRTICEVATTHAERIHIRKLRPDAFPDSGLV